MYSIHTTILQYFGGYECTCRVYEYEAFDTPAELVAKRRAFLEHDPGSPEGIIDALVDVLNRYSSRLQLGPGRLTDEELSEY